MFKQIKTKLFFQLLLNNSAKMRVLLLFLVLQTTMTAVSEGIELQRSSHFSSYVHKHKLQCFSNEQAMETVVVKSLSHCLFSCLASPSCIRVNHHHHSCRLFNHTYRVCSDYNLVIQTDCTAYQIRSYSFYIPSYLV